mgnify:CR=1 FL=1
MLVDLHLHSRASDGTMTPGEIAREGARRGFGMLALADHNTDKGWGPFAAACRKAGVIPLRGMELDCLYDRWDIHLLAYGYIPTRTLTDLAAHSLGRMLDMSDDLVRRLLPAFSQLSWEEWSAYEADPAQGGWKGLQYLRDKGVIGRLEDGMGLYKEQGCDYRDYSFPAMEEACRVVRASGGVPVLAHPANWFASLSQPELYRHLDAMAELGLGGIECHYPSHTPEMTWMCRCYCRRHGWLMTAGSDWHGEFNKVAHGVTYELGRVRVDLGELDLGNLLEAGGTKG